MKESELGEKTAGPLRYPGFPVDLDGVGGPHAPFLKSKTHTWLCLALRAGNPGSLRLAFFVFRCNLQPESSQEHLPTSIARVLRLRAIKPSVCEKSAKRFAQDDGFMF